MKTLYEFIGGHLADKKRTREEVEQIATGHSRNWSRERSQGGRCPRAELDDQPTVAGYVGPMWDGLRYEIDGELRSDWDLTEEEKKGKEPIAILR